MNGFTAFIMSIVTLLSSFFGAASVTFSVDTSEPGDVVSNKVSNANVWDMGSQFINVKRNTRYDIGDYVEYIQLMQCSGGTPQRDLFVDPTNTDVLDDYNFTRLVANCRGILSLGAKPMLKLGGVPCKYTKDYEYGNFGMNVYPPDDYTVYYNYIKALAQALVDAFGKDEVLTWRFGCMTEYENADWFYARDKSAYSSFVEYCKLYDYTVQALIDVLGNDVFVGAHAMAVTQGLWDEEKFIEHVAKGTNYANGGTGTRICYLSGSFYDTRIGTYGTDTLENTINHMRVCAEANGLNDLVYGIDEGRILAGTRGTDSDALNMRITGYTWQAAYDARLFTKAVRNDIDYISSWGNLTGGLLNGYPTVSWHVAQNVRKMAGGKKVKTASTTSLLNTLRKIEVDGCAVYNEQTSTAHIMLYNFKNALGNTKAAKVNTKLNVPQFAGKTATVTLYLINDDCNFFDEWQEDRVKHGITDDKFCWSPDDPAIDTTVTLSDSAARKTYNDQLRDKYIECSKLTPTEQTVTFDENGCAEINVTLEADNAAFLEITCK